MRRHVLVLVGTAVVLSVVAGGALVVRDHGRAPEHGSSAYCAVLGNPWRTVVRIRLAVAGTPMAREFSLRSLRAEAPTLYSDRVVEGAPDSLRGEARIAVVAFRAAVAQRRTDVLDTRQVDTALATLRVKSAESCPASHDPPRSEVGTHSTPE